MSIVAARAGALLLVARGALSNAIIAGAMKYDFLFEDGALFSVPPGWREVSGRRFGAVDRVEFEARLRFVVGNDYLVLGTVDRSVWRQRTRTPPVFQNVLDQLHEFKRVVRFELAPRWAPAEPRRTEERR